MTIRLKTKQQIKDLREGGKRLAYVLDAIVKETQEGTSLMELDKLAERLIKKEGGKPAFKGYTPSAATEPYPNTLCTSLNSVAVHERPTSYALRDGDVISIDIGIIFRGLITDMAVTLPIGNVSKQAQQLITTAKEALDEGIRAAISKNTIGDIGNAVQTRVHRGGFRVLKDLTGHGVGFELHEDPYVYNFGKPHTGFVLEPGLVIAIEPIIAERTEYIIQRRDESFATADNSLAAHFEHSIAITENGPLILTEL
ncbi:MAG: type I methionyl aminopeptidase [Parcubacteria group bacterium]|nr:type I methionyl aminopeptidase [Parcubacteria group bacterium]